MAGSPGTVKVKKNEPKKALTAQQKATRIAIWAVAGVVLLVVLAGAMIYTEQSSFCPTCHEMKPYYDAWLTGGHAKDASCVDCHVDPGVLAHILHKPQALKEVWDHFFTDNRFPNWSVDVPNSRCVRCHEKVPDKIGAMFSHAKHEKKSTCKNCHTQSGHTVALATLQQYGILKANAATPTINGMTPSSAPGHKKVICQDCHNQASMKCSSCHTPPHENRGECSGCHKPGDKFSYSHSSDSNCASCHKPPANHYGTNCADCHDPGTPFNKTVFHHPGTHHNINRLKCAQCHPNGAPAVYCTCHKGHPPTD